MSRSNKSLPAKYQIRLVKWFWNALWQQMMSRLASTNKSGEYIRPESQFRNTINNELNHTYQSATQRYHLYVGLSCPWAHRTLVVRALKGLEPIIPVSLVIPDSNSGIWVMEKPMENCYTLPELYKLSQSNYQGRCTVPVLWDTQTRTIVNNESAEIVKILNCAFNQWASNHELNLYPDSLEASIEELNQKIYNTVNNGVYRCGFAQTQEAYNQAVTALFHTLDILEESLKQTNYLLGQQITLADVHLFTTLFRFDTVYYSLFKCNLKRITDYPQLSRYLRQIYNLPGIASTCNLEQIKQDYYGNLFPLNPGGIIPVGPDSTLFYV